MAATHSLHFYYAPQSRARATLALFEELGVTPEMTLLNLKAGSQRDAAYLAINPMGKVPAITYDGVLVSEQAAIFIFLADLYPSAGLAPALDDPLRGAYLRWMVYYGSCFEPALVDRALQRTPAPASTSPYGDHDTMLNTLLAQLRAGPYLLGDRLSAADLLWGPALQWTTRFKLVPESPEVMAYIERIAQRPAQQRAAAREEAYAAAQASA
jgi:glutathione S-transferase